jgi:hypothetical protein
VAEIPGVGPGDYYRVKYGQATGEITMLRAAIRVIRREAARQSTEAERTILQVCNRVLKKVG